MPQSGSPTPTSAELIKYGVNAFLALKISFINEMAQLCEFTGADVSSVADGIGTDERIGRAFLGAGLGFGGSCFPKDVRALDQAASYHGQSFLLLRAAVEVNQQARSRFVAKIQRALNGKLAKRRIAVLGLAFKPGTDDVRQAASIDVIRHLEDLGAVVVATDPVAGDQRRALLPNTELVDDPYDCVIGADAVVVVTEWPEYVGLDWASGRAPWCAAGWSSTGATASTADPLVELGFTYIGVGRPTRKPQTVQVAPAAAGERTTRAARRPMTWDSVAGRRDRRRGVPRVSSRRPSARRRSRGDLRRQHDHRSPEQRRDISTATAVSRCAPRTSPARGASTERSTRSSISPRWRRRWITRTIRSRRSRWARVGTMNALRIAQEKGARFLLASTSEVYGDPLVHPQPETYWGNVNPIGPRSVYDESKRVSETFAMAFIKDRQVSTSASRGSSTPMDRGCAPTTGVRSRSS